MVGYHVHVCDSDGGSAREGGGNNRVSYCDRNLRMESVNINKTNS